MRILVVDDDVAIREVLADLLEEEGHDLLLAEDGQAAVEIAETYRPDLVLMDLRLPVLDGAAATRRLKRDPATKNIRVVAMSASEGLVPDSDQLPVDGVLPKPFDIEHVLALIDEGVRAEQPALAVAD